MARDAIRMRRAAEPDQPIVRRTADENLDAAVAEGIITAAFAEEMRALLKPKD